jgi:hypothetical protein
MKALLFSLLCLFASQLAFGQQENNDSLVVITLTNGEVRVGKIITDDGREILLETKEIGKIYIRKENIKSIVAYQPEKFKEVGGELRSTGPFTTRYYFTTNSFPMLKGENYAVVNLYGPEVHFAVTDKLNLGVMASWIASPFIFSAKYSIPTANPKLNFGLGTLAGTSGYLNNFRGFGGLHWGMVTYGDRMTNVTFSVGYSYIKTGILKYDNIYKPGIYPAKESEYFPGNYEFTPLEPSSEKLMDPAITSPVIGIGAITKVGKNASFILDGMLFIAKQPVIRAEQNVDPVYDINTGQPSYTSVSEVSTFTDTYNTTMAFLMPGMRFQNKPNRAFQVSLAGVIHIRDGDVNTFPIPMVNWFFKF